MSEHWNDKMDILSILQKLTHLKKYSIHILPPAHPGTFSFYGFIVQGIEIVKVHIYQWIPYWTPDLFGDFFTVNRELHDHNTRQALHYHIPSFKANLGKTCLRYSFESSRVLYSTPTCTSSMQELIKQGMGQYWKSPAFDARRTLGMSSLIIFYNLLNILLLLLIDLDILTTILPKTDVPCPWIWLLYLVSINSACRLPLIITDHLCILAIILPLSTVAKEHSIATTAKLRSLIWLIPKTLLLMW